VGQCFVHLYRIQYRAFIITDHKTARSDVLLPQDCRSPKLSSRSEGFLMGSGPIGQLATLFIRSWIISGLKTGSGLAACFGPARNQVAP